MVHIFHLVNEKHNIPVYINNKKIYLPELAEESITIYSKHFRN